MMQSLRDTSKGSSIIVIIFTSVHSVLFFVTPSPLPKAYFENVDSKWPWVINRRSK